MKLSAELILAGADEVEVPSTAPHPTFMQCDGLPGLWIDDYLDDIADGLRWLSHWSLTSSAVSIYYGNSYKQSLGRVKNLATRQLARHACSFFCRRPRLQACYCSLYL